ncbi:M-like protein [Deinococcus sp. QL22]|uniref:M-like protein n=1 Tax=Deinococcus sp. QL22 TaxID=2939437 RepID=UPI002017756F|nr:M-like protein [Deinococcus sp. QL22]UQN05965.1 M-like protein [Deinococcus sp. QL22]
MTNPNDQSGQIPADASVKTEDEITNVDLQFMGKPDPRKEIAAEVSAQSKAPGEFENRGMDKQDVASAGSMVASDPPSSNMGEDGKLGE